jgi:glycosyltransferase involved in cell wall biosynthesis
MNTRESASATITDRAAISVEHREPRPLSVSVIIPTYNRAALLRAAIESVLNQTRVPEEIIVIDDGSTDATEGLLREFGSQIRAIRQPNRGRSAARNAGLRVARGELILFLDSDDLLQPHCVERCARLLELHPDVDVIYSDAYVIDGAGDIVGRYSHALRGTRPSGMILGELARRCFITVSSMVRSSCLDGEWFEEGMEHCEDYDLWRRLSARCRFLFVDEPLLGYRFHEGMTNATQRGSILNSEVEVQRRFMSMSEFEQLSRRERARVYCAHGIKNAMLDRTQIARAFFLRAVRTSPLYVGGLALAVVSLCGSRALRQAIVVRRRLAGNQLGTQSDPLSAIRRATTPTRNRSAMPQPTATFSDTVASEKS